MDSTRSAGSLCGDRGGSAASDDCGISDEWNFHSPASLVHSWTLRYPGNSDFTMGHSPTPYTLHTARPTETHCKVSRGGSRNFGWKGFDIICNTSINIIYLQHLFSKFHYQLGSPWGGVEPSKAPPPRICLWIRTSLVTGRPRWIIRSYRHSHRMQLHEVHD